MKCQNLTFVIYQIKNFDYSQRVAKYENKREELVRICCVGHAGGQGRLPDEKRGSEPELPEALLHPEGKSSLLLRQKGRQGAGGRRHSRRLHDW